MSALGTPTRPRPGQPYKSRAAWGTAESETSRPRLESRVIPFKAPKTGSDSGFIKPLELSKLCSRRAFP